MDTDAAQQAVGGGISTALDPLKLRDIVALLARPRALAG